MKRYNKIIIYLIILIMISNFMSCTNTAGLSSQPSSEAESLLSSQLPSESSSIPNISGKGDLWANKRLKIGLAGPGYAGEWSVVFSNNLKQKAEEWKIELYQNGDPARMGQIYSIEKFIEDEMDIIALYTYNYYADYYGKTSWDEVLKKVREAEIPVILIDQGIYCKDESLWTTYIVNDWEKEGEMAGKWLIEHLEKEERIDKEIKIAELRGTEDTTSAQQVWKGFRDEIKEYQNVEITISKCGEYIKEIGYEVMQEILSETTDIDVLFCHNDEMAIGAIEAIEEAGLVPGEDIIIVSILGTNAALEAILEGKIACSVETNPLLGDLFMEACVRLANGEEIEREIHPVDRVFDITNAQAELDAREENGYGY